MKYFNLASYFLWLISVIILALSVRRLVAKNESLLNTIVMQEKEIARLLDKYEPLVDIWKGRDLMDSSGEKAVDL